jgi:hypothetical protein
LPATKRAYTIEVSTNLAHWDVFANLVNTSGTVEINAGQTECPPPETGRITSFAGEWIGAATGKVIVPDSPPNPGGIRENSPRFQPWERAENASSPEGTAEKTPARLCGLMPWIKKRSIKDTQAAY